MHCTLSYSDFQSSYTLQQPKTILVSDRVEENKVITRLGKFLEFINKNICQKIKLEKQHIKVFIWHTCDTIVAHAAPAIP